VAACLPGRGSCTLSPGDPRARGPITASGVDGALRDFLIPSIDAAIKDGTRGISFIRVVGRKFDEIRKVQEAAKNMEVFCRTTG
jgi:hypothetical protein